MAGTRWLDSRKNFNSRIFSAAAGPTRLKSPRAGLLWEPWVREPIGESQTGVFGIGFSPGTFSAAAGLTPPRPPQTPRARSARAGRLGGVSPGAAEKVPGENPYPENPCL